MKDLIQILNAIWAVSAIFSMLDDESGHIMSDLGRAYLRGEIELELLTED